MRLIASIFFVLIVSACSPTKEIVRVETRIVEVPVPAIAETLYANPTNDWLYGDYGGYVEATGSAKVETVKVWLGEKKIYVKTKPDTIKIMDTDTLKIVEIKEIHPTFWESMQTGAVGFAAAILLLIVGIIVWRFKLI